MSYILQALKKSEQEREQLNSSLRAKEELTSAETVKTDGLNAAKSHDAAASSISNGRVVLLISLALMLLVILGYLNQNSEVESVAIIKHDAKSIEQVLVEKVSTKAAESAAAEETVVTKKMGEQDQSAEPSGKIADESQIIRPTIAVEQVAKSIQSLIPTLEISSHIFSSLAVRRSIVVNGTRLIEGDFISPEIQVKEITQQGMIIDVNGWPLVVSRSRGWSR